MNDASTPAASRYGTPRQKVPPFARFKGTSAWKKYGRRAREYALFRAAQSQASQAQAQAAPRS